MRNFKKIKKNRGMTYVELIVVLSIFAIMSSIVLFNYGEFQARVDIKNLANDIASKLAEAQKIALSGSLPIKTVVASWKPAYGIYFNTVYNATSNKSFIYFADIDQNDFNSDNSFCASALLTDECISKIDITKGNYISNITIYYPSSSSVVTDLSLVFKRPNSGVIMYTTNGGGQFLTGASYAEITISSSGGVISKIRAYASGRIQVNQ